MWADMVRGIRIGLTVVGLLVLGVLGVGLFGPHYDSLPPSARVDTARLLICSFTQALEIYADDVGRYPDTLMALVESPGGSAGWRGPYLKDGRLPKDPWGVPFDYRPYADGYDLQSFGSDNRPGGKDHAADIRFTAHFSGKQVSVGDCHQAVGIR